MQFQSVVGAMSVFVAPEPPCAGVNKGAYESYLCAYRDCAEDRLRCKEQLMQVFDKAGVVGFQAVGATLGAGRGVIEYVGEGIPVLTSYATAATECVVEPSVCVEKGKNWARNQRRKVARKAASSAASVHTVDTRTGVEIEAAQTLAARRVAENQLAVKKAEAERLLTQHRINALNDKDRTKAVERLAATRMEEKINVSKKKSEEAFNQCEASLKSLGSTGSAGEFALKQQIKDARDNEALLKYVQEQNRILTQNASPEVLDAISRVKRPVIQEEFDAFGDCPSDYDEDEAEAYNNDRNRRNDEMAQKLQGVDEAPLW